jgi:putative glutamine amidotransferase
MQSLNVWCGGSLLQDLQTGVIHRASRAVEEAHAVVLGPDTRLSSLLPAEAKGVLQVNSTHHQAVRLAGDRLRIAAVSPLDGVVEAVELNSLTHFVVGIQWHPERTLEQSAFSRSVFDAFVRAAAGWHALLQAE